MKKKTVISTARLFEVIRKLQGPTIDKIGPASLIGELGLKEEFYNSRIFYKVIKKGKNGQKLSLHNKDFPVRYKVGKWTKPDLTNSKLFVFDNIRDARHHVNAANKEM